MDNFRLDGKKSANYYVTLYSNISFLLGEEKGRKSSVCIPLDTSLSSVITAVEAGEKKKNHGKSLREQESGERKPPVSKTI
jgi:hypothetical protein